MTIAMQPIYTQTVGAGGVSSVTFNNIPQTFTDLKAVVSVRSSTNADPSFYWSYNIGGSVYSLTRLSGTGSAANSTRQTGLTFHRIDGGADGTGETASTFSSIDVYIPNYAGANFKSAIVDLVSENNATAADSVLVASLCASTTAITTLNFSVDGTSAQFSTFTLYGITKG
jgi:hypothetical protein